MTFWENPCCWPRKDACHKKLGRGSYINEKLTSKLQELVLYSHNASSFYEFQQSVRRAAQTLEKNRKALVSRQITPTTLDTVPRR